MRPTKIPNPQASLIQQVDAHVCAVILRGRWPQAGKYWTPGACLVRVTTRHIARIGYNFVHGFPNQRFGDATCLVSRVSLPGYGTINSTLEQNKLRDVADLCA